MIHPCLFRASVQRQRSPHLRDTWPHAHCGLTPQGPAGEAGRRDGGMHAATDGPGGRRATEGSEPDPEGRRPHACLRGICKVSGAEAPAERLPGAGRGWNRVRSVRVCGCQVTEPRGCRAAEAGCPVPDAHTRKGSPHPAASQPAARGGTRTACPECWG